jgi:hypothetical protein
MKGGDVSSVSPLVSFALGAAMATACVLFFVSASPTRRLADISAFSTANSTDDNLRLASDGDGGAAAAADGNGEAPPDVAAVTTTPAPAPAPVEVRIPRLPAVRPNPPPCIFSRSSPADSSSILTNERSSRLPQITKCSSRIETNRIGSFLGGLFSPWPSNRAVVSSRRIPVRSATARRLTTTLLRFFECWLAKLAFALRLSFLDRSIALTAARAGHTGSDFEKRERKKKRTAGTGTMLFLSPLLHTSTTSLLLLVYSFVLLRNSKRCPFVSFSFNQQRRI